MESIDFSGTYCNKIKWQTSNKHCFIASGQPKDDFNATVPSAMGSKIPAYFESRLLALNLITTNALGFTAAQFTDSCYRCFKCKTSGKTTFFDGTNVLTGRVADDVIDVELLLIFGGEDGGSKAWSYF
jgi:hypothetical protein